MVPDIRAIYQALLAFLQVNPTGEEQAFKTSAVNAGLGTEECLGNFLACWYQTLFNAGFVDMETWAAMLDRLATVGFERFQEIADVSFGQIYKAPEMCTVQKQAQLEQINEILDNAVVRKTDLEPGRAWIEANMPEGDQKFEVLRVLDAGRIHEIDSVESHYNRLKDRITEELGE